MKQNVNRPQLIAYGTDDENFGVLRVPSGPGPHPIAIIIHGGMWQAMYDLDYMKPACDALADAGIAAWNIEYRRVGNGGGFPTIFEDVARAVDHVREFAPQFNLDLKRVVTVGHSAGGHLALWVAGRQRIPKTSPLAKTAKNPLALRAAISLAGMNDLRLGFAQSSSQPKVNDLLGGAPSKYADRYAATSPMEMLPLGVPQVLFHGTEDVDVPFEMSKIYHAAATAKGDSVTFVQLRGAGHFELVNPRTPEWKQVLQTIQSALK